MTIHKEHQPQDPPVTLFAHISARFEQLELTHWTAVVFFWLARYDGISQCYFEDEEDSPALEVLRCVSNLPRGVSDKVVADSLSRLDFLSWRIRHPVTEARWDPLVQPLTEFMGCGCAIPPVCWKWEGAYPSSPAIAAWLIGQLPKR